MLDTHLSAIQCILTRPPHCEKAVQSKQTQIKLRRTGENGLVWSPSLWLHTRELGRGTGGFQLERVVMDTGYENLQMSSK